VGWSSETFSPVQGKLSDIRTTAAQHAFRRELTGKLYKRLNLQGGKHGLEFTTGDTEEHRVSPFCSVGHACPEE
jgi:hypothetical protein